MASGIHRDLEHQKHLSTSQQKSYVHYFTSNHLKSPAKPVVNHLIKLVGHKSTESFENRSVYKQSFNSQWDEQTRPWYHHQNPWPWLVDTRRTVNPKYEVGKTQKQEICNQYERSLMRSKKAPTIDLTEQKSRYTLSATQSRNKLFTESSKKEQEFKSGGRVHQPGNTSAAGDEYGMQRSKSASGCPSRQSARKSFNEGVVGNIRKQLMTEQKPPR